MPANVTVSGLAPLPDGHAGLSFSFDLVHDHHAESFVLKVAPSAVPRSGSTDVYRQVRLLRALKAAGYPAPDVPWASRDDNVLGAPFIVMERLPGRTFIVWDPAPEFLESRRRLPRLWMATADALGQLHQLDWRRDLADWERPTSLDEEMERWVRLLRHTADGKTRELAALLFATLEDRKPPDGEVGIVHGDLQPGNVLFENHRAAGVIDWDLAAIAPQSLDVGWLLMIADRPSWVAGWSPRGAPARGDLLVAYHGAGGTVTSDLDWHQAFAHFRMAVITGLNLKLHRSGRRPDPTWERFAECVPRLVQRGLYLVR
jgi:aminoglycoside phosphotransferase (APT) family kinase protein